MSKKQKRDRGGGAPRPTPPPAVPGYELYAHWAVLVALFVMPVLFYREEFFFNKMLVGIKEFAWSKVLLHQFLIFPAFLWWAWRRARPWGGTSTAGGDGFFPLYFFAGLGLGALYWYILPSNDPATGIGYLLLGVATSLAGWWLARWGRTGPEDRAPVPEPTLSPRAVTFPLVFVFVAFVAASLLWGINRWKGIDLIVQEASIFLAYLLVLEVFRTRRAVVSLYIACAAAIVIVSVYGILQYWEYLYLPVDQYGQKNPTSSLGLTNFSAEYMMNVLPMMLTLVALSLRDVLKGDEQDSMGAWIGRLVGGVVTKPRALLAFLVALVSFYYFILCKNRAGDLGVIASMLATTALYLLWRWRRGVLSGAFVRRFALGVASFAVVMGLFLGFTEAGHEATHKFVTIFNPTDNPRRFRIETWKGALRLIRDNPVVGVGFGNLEVMFPKYEDAKLEQMLALSNTRVDRCHNEYLEVWSEEGSIGLGLYLLLLGVILWLGVSTLLQAPDAEWFWFGVSSFSGILALLVSNNFNFALEIPPPATYFWVLVALLEVIRRAQKAEIARRAPAGEAPAEAAAPRGLLAGLEAGRDRVLALLGPKRPTILLGTAGIVAAIFAGSVYYTVVSLRSDVLYKEGLAYENFQNWVKAEEQFNQSIAWKPYYEAALYDRGYCYIKLNRFEEARRDMEACLKLVPYLGKARKVMGIIYENLGRHEEALQEFRYAYNALPSSRNEVLRDLTFSLVHTGNFQEAVERGEEAARVNPTDPGIFFNLGISYFRLGKFPQAASSFESVIKLTPDHVESYTNLGATYMMMQSNDRAIDVLRRGVERRPENPQLLYSLADAYGAKGDKGRMIQSLSRAFELDPVFMQRATADTFLARYRTDVERLIRDGKARGKNRAGR